MKRRKVCCCILSVVLLIGICVGVILYRNGMKSEAATLPGVEKVALLNDSANPYVIVEVVADKADARFGYLVGGEEPIREGKSIRDMPSAMERLDAMLAFDADHSSAQSLIDAGIISYGTPYAESSSGNTAYEIRGTMIPTAGGDYSYAAISAVYAPIDPSVSDNDIQHYEKYIDFDFEYGEYGVTFGSTNHLSVGDLVLDGMPIYHKYEVSETIINASDNDWLKSHDGERVYVRSYDENTEPKYDYYGLLSIDLEADPVALDVKKGDGSIEAVSSLTSDYLLLSVTTNDNAGSYIVKGYVSGLINGGFEKNIHYEADDEGGYYKVSSGGTDLVYDAGHTGSYVFQSNYSTSILDTVRYENGITNAEYFKKHVLDIDENYTDTFICDVKVMTMDEFNASTFTGVNMVVLRAGSYTSGMDITPEKAKSLYEEVKDNKLPVVIEGGFGSDIGNNKKISALLRQKTSSNISSSSVKDYWDNDNFWNNGSNGVYKNVNTSTSMFVNGSVLVCPGNNFVADDFLTKVAAANYEGENSGLYRVYAEISSENAFLSRTGSSERISSDINKASALRYIINYASQRVIVKSEISVLEIEPCYSFNMTYGFDNSKSNSLRNVFIPDEYYDGLFTFDDGIRTLNSVDRNVLTPDIIANNWATQFKNGNSGNIKLVQTYTKEFIGKVEDLNENYDLIYIGLDTSTMNTRVTYTENFWGTRTYRDKTAQTVYNDSSMNGLVYTHMGDYATGAGSELNFGSNRGTNRYSGNDITKQKLLELENFIEAGYPVIFADNFFTVSGGLPSDVNTSLVDRSSNMYQLGRFVLDNGYHFLNVFYDSQVRNSEEVKKKLSNYLNTSKLTIESSVVPTVFDASMAVPNYLQKRNGVYTLDFEFALKNDAAVSVSNTTYDVKLYIDTSVDGRFTKEEEISSLSVKEYTNGSWYGVSHDSEGKYNLVAGKNYRIERQVPTGYTGILPWKLRFTQNGNEKVRKSLSGYTAIAAETKPVIKVLQLTSQTGDITLDLQSDFVRNEIAKINDFELSIEKYRSDDFIKTFGNTQDKAFNKLCEYDMLIVGFGDSFEFKYTGTNGVNMTRYTAQAIKQYIGTGRSVLFTHDTTSFYNGNSNQWGYAFNQYIRSTVGMDRYNVMNEMNPSTDEFDKVQAIRGVTESRIQGYSDATINRYSSVDQYHTTSRGAMGASDSGNRGGIYNSSNMYVTKVNDGQITNYPFKIHDQFQVAVTHAQYYQLNLDTLIDDANADDDIVVWYCISDINGADADDIYQATPNDVRNNYYIYNKGNVTYSGVGHRAVTNQEELHLFINTMVAAYAAGVHPPKVSYFDDGAVNDSVVNTYMLYDKASSTYIDNSVDMFFEIADNNFVQGRRELKVHYYLPDSVSGTVHTGGPVDDEGRDIKIKEFSPAIKRGGSTVSDILNLEPDVRYQMYVTKEQLNNASKDVAEIYISTEMLYYAEGEATPVSSGVGFFNLNVVRSELLDLE